MFNRRKKIIALALAATMCIGILTGCSTKRTNSGNINEITWMGYPTNSSSQEGTFPEQLLENKFGVDIKPYFLPYGNYNDKKTMMISGGEIPDLIYEMDPMYVSADVSQNVLCEISYETIKKYCPTIYKQITENAPSAWLYSYVDGKNYGIPNLNFLNAKTKIGMWREDWLKNVGIDKVPETIDEMYVALQKFTKEDPDKNGKNDTYGMTGTITSWNLMFTDIFGAYGVIPFNWVKDKNGNVVYGGFEEGTYQALETLNKWYSEGLIHPDFILDSPSTTGKEKFLNGVVGYMNQNGGYFAPDDKSSIPNVAKSINSNAQIALSSPVKGPDGDAGTHTWGLPCHIISFGKQLEDQPEKLHKILEMLEAMVSDEEFMLELKLGEKGKHWDLADPNGTISDGVKFLPPFDDVTQRTNECINDTFNGPTFFMPVAPTYQQYEKYFNKNQVAVYEKYCSDVTAYTDVFMKPDVLPSASKYFEDIKTVQINLMVKAIKGEITISEYKKEFAKSWKKMGGEQLETEAATMFKTLNKILKEVGA